MVPSSISKTGTRLLVDLVGLAQAVITNLVCMPVPFRSKIKLTLLVAGGHASQKIAIPKGVEVVKVQVGGDRELDGLRFTLSDGTAGGHLRNVNSARTLGKP